MIHSTSTGFVDFPGHYALTIFFNGCNLNCPFCYNREVCRADRANMSIRDVYEQIGKVDSLFDFKLGVVFSGGEPTIAPEFKRMVYDLHNKKHPLALHTNGLTLPMRGDLFDAVILSLKPKNCGLPKAYLSGMAHAMSIYSPCEYKELRIVEEEDPSLVEDLKKKLEALEGPINHNGFTVKWVPKEVV